MKPQPSRSSSRRPRRAGRPAAPGRYGTRRLPPPPTYSARPQALHDPAPVPFSTFQLHPTLLQGLKDLGFAETRPVQSAVLPYALAGDDVIASAETGSGKTAAFVLPILQRLLTATELTAGVRTLILAPTRELAVQIEDTIQGLSYHTAITSAAVYGGVPMDPQSRALAAGVHIVVATPGRLMDHMRQPDLVDFSSLEVLVLDEADRMMDMGFWPDVERIVAQVPATRQTLLFSATVTDDVMRQATSVTRDPRYLELGRSGGPAETISHHVETVESGRKVAWLVGFLRRVHGPTLVFVRTKSGADRLARQLAAGGVRAVALHGDRSQQERTAAVEGFRGGRHRVLVATDLAARGLDIEGITHVVNFEVPDTPEAYVHRVGRTGRDRSTGTAVTLVSPEEVRALRALEKSVGVELQRQHHGRESADQAAG